MGAVAVADGSREACAAGRFAHVSVCAEGSVAVCACRWPRFTMLGQSIGSMVVAFQGLRACTPHVFVDTTGCAFTYFVAKVLAGLPVATYTHYPTITSVCCCRMSLVFGLCRLGCTLLFHVVCRRTC